MTKPEHQAAAGDGAPAFDPETFLADQLGEFADLFERHKGSAVTLDAGAVRKLATGLRLLQEAARMVTSELGHHRQIACLAREASNGAR